MTINERAAMRDLDEGSQPAMRELRVAELDAVGGGSRNSPFGGPSPTFPPPVEN